MKEPEAENELASYAQERHTVVVDPMKIDNGDQSISETLQ